MPSGRHSQAAHLHHFTQTARNNGSARYPATSPHHTHVPDHLPDPARRHCCSGRRHCMGRPTGRSAAGQHQRPFQGRGLPQRTSRTALHGARWHFAGLAQLPPRRDSARCPSAPGGAGAWVVRARAVEPYAGAGSGRRRLCCGLPGHEGARSLRHPGPGRLYRADGRRRRGLFARCAPHGPANADGFLRRRRVCAAFRGQRATEPV